MFLLPLKKEFPVKSRYPADFSFDLPWGGGCRYFLEPLAHEIAVN